MEISIVGDNNYLVKFSPTETRLFNDLVYATDYPPEKILASMIFRALAVKHSELELSNTLEKFDDHQMNGPKPYNPANRD